jgi:NAD(P)-dependent dehydrogenase (short-subunit alcohol dehydrogenase family)
MSKRFSDKIMVITGAGGVLCSAFAKHLAAEGAAVCVRKPPKPSPMRSQRQAGTL